MIARIKNFFEGVRQEWRHVNWPTRAQAIYLTTIVIVLSVSLAIFLGLFDALYLQLLKTFVLKA